MVYRVEVGLKPDFRDIRGERVKDKIFTALGKEIEQVKVIDAYTIDADLKIDDVKKAAEGPFSDPIIQEYSIGKPLSADFEWLVEIGFRPGVTDNVGRTAREAIEYIIGRDFTKDEGVFTSENYLIKGKLSRKDVEKIAVDILSNELIQNYRIFRRKEWDAEAGAEIIVPKVRQETQPHVEEIDLNVSDEELIALSRDGLLALSLEEMLTIKEYFSDAKVIAERKSQGIGEKITDVELEALAQTWSEHCKHKIFNARITYWDDRGGRKGILSLFDSYIRGSTEFVRRGRGEKDICVSVFKDNAGVIKFNDEYNLVFKVETHNSPSALDPYGGALTGIVGVNRDPFGTGIGSRLIFNVDTFCFASPDYDKPLPPRLMHPSRIFEGVVEGVEHGGNKSGIPTINGSVVFDDRYAGKPLVYCGTAGIMPAVIGGKPSHEKTVNPGDLIVMTGGRIGKDGIHGATFSSEELHEGSPVTAVQIGDPITQKRMTDFLLKARDLGLYRAITDNGAGGLSSSVGETARLSGGCRIDLTKAPLKYAGLMPWEILLSEAQERMTLAVAPDKIEEFMNLARRMNVEATVLGEYNDSDKFHVIYDGRTVAYLDMEFFHEGLPQMELVARWEPKVYPEPDFPEEPNLTETLLAMMSRLNICSKESIIRRYDHEVQGGSTIKPLVGEANDGPGDAGVVRPLLDSMEGVVTASGICPRYSDIDAYQMMACAIDEAVRNAVCVGAGLEHLAGLDNFCWCDPVKSEKTPDGEYKLAQLVRANMALYDYCTIYGVPCISGKDSMKNDYHIGDVKISIPPTVLFSVIGRIDDVRKAVTMDGKREGDLVYVLGSTFNELGGSEYFAMRGFIGNHVPRVNAVKAKRMYQSLSEAIRDDLVASCHDCSDGGLGVALVETAFAGGLGMRVDLGSVPREGVSRDDYLMFSESQSRFVVTISPEDQKEFEKRFYGMPFAMVGKLSADPRFIIWGLKGDVIVDGDIFEFKYTWQKPLDF